MGLNDDAGTSCDEDAGAISVVIDARGRSVIRGIAGRGIRILFTTPSVFLPSMIFPLFFLAAFGGGLSPVGTVPGFKFSVGYTSFVFAFVVLQASAFAGVFTGFAVARDLESGFTHRLFLAAPNRSAIVAGYALTALVRGIFSASVVTVAGVIGGMDFAGNGVDLLGLIGLGLIMNQGALLWATGVAMRLRTIQAGPLMQIPVFLTLFLSPVYVPTDLLERWLKAIANLNPFTYMVEAGRGFIAGTSTDVLLAFGLGLAAAVVLSVWALRGLRSAEANP